MNTDRIDQIFACARSSEPYMQSVAFEAQLCKRLYQLDGPQLWLQLALPALGAFIGIFIFASTGGLSYVDQLVQSLAASALGMPIWTAGLISLSLSAVSLFGVKKYLQAVV